jgi:hypothetical protein
MPEPPELPPLPPVLPGGAFSYGFLVGSPGVVLHPATRLMAVATSAAASSLDRYRANVEVGLTNSLLWGCVSVTTREWL